MGVDLGSLVPGEPIRMDALSGKAVAMDGNNTIYQFLASIRGRDGKPLSDAQGRVTSHLAGYLYRMANLVEAGIQPAVVWDGRPPELKAATIQERRERRAQAQEDYEQALEEGDMERARTKAMQATRVGKEQFDQATRLLGLLGIPTVQAPSEGEAQAVQLVKEGTVDAAGSQDYDALLFGAPLLVRNLTSTGRRKLPGRNQWIEVQPERIDLREALKALEIDRERLIWLALLIGTDFNDGVKGIGPKKGIKAVREATDLPGLCEDTGLELELAEEVTGFFLEPPVEQGVELSWGTPDREGVLEMLCGEHGFSEDRVNKALDRIQEGLSKGRQRSLFDF